MVSSDGRKVPGPAPENSGVMFKVTAKTCKKWADDAHKQTFSDLLGEIASAARKGKYSIIVKDLPDKAEELLVGDGFMILPQGKGKGVLISWL